MLGVLGLPRILLGSLSQDMVVKGLLALWTGKGFWLASVEFLSFLDSGSKDSRRGAGLEA